MENGTDYGLLVRQNSELLRTLDELEKTCNTLREENGLLRKSSAPETEEKVRRLRRKNTELTVLAKRLEERARKLQEANLKVVNPPSLIRPAAVEQYKRAFARQRARDLAQHADALLSKDKEIAALQQECRQLEARLGPAKDSPIQSSQVEYEKLLRESQKEVLRLQRQLSVTSSRQRPGPRPDGDGTDKCEENAKEAERSGITSDVFPQEPRIKNIPGITGPEEPTEEQRLQFLERELSRKRKECENLEHEVKKRQKRCLDLESQLEDERGKNEQLKEEAELLRRKAQLLDQARAENEELREDLSEVTAQHNSVLEENQRLRAKLENLEQVLKHMREVAERRQQLELEHEQALAILKFKQDEIKRLQRAQLFAKREHEGVVQMLESTLDCMQSKVRELEEKCRSQSEQFGLLSQELEKFRLQASKVDLASSTLLRGPRRTQQDSPGWSTRPSPSTESCPPSASASRGLPPSRKPRTSPPNPTPTSVRTNRARRTRNTTLAQRTHCSSLPQHPISICFPQVDTASEVEELDIDVAPAPYTASRGAAKLQVFIARYSYNPYDGPNDNPEVELPLTAGEYIYVYGDMDDDGFYEGELMDGRRGLVPSNFVERVSDDDVMSAQHPETGDVSHNSLLDSSLHSASHQHHLHLGAGASERTEASAASGPASVLPDAVSASSVPAPLTNGLDLDLEEVGVDVVPYPRKLTLIKQLAKSIIIGWDPPLVPAGWGNVWSYNVYVDQELRLNVPFGAQTKAVLERLDVNLKAYRVSVQSLTEKGVSDQLRCSMLVGRDVCVAPTQLHVDRVTATSANLTWLPSNSNYVHVVSLNDEECELVKAGCYSLCLNNLLPSLQYTAKVEARPHRMPWELPAERREHRSATVSFSTLMAGPPDAPLDVQLEPGPSPGIALISWLPVTIDAAGTSNGVRVTGYTIYADKKKKVLEVASPTAGSALLGPSQIQALQAAQELTVRTMSAHGESCDSFPVNVPSKLAAVMAGPTPTAPVVPHLPCTPVAPSNLSPLPSYGSSAAKVSALPNTLPSGTQRHGPAVEAAANLPHALHSQDRLLSASYVKAWADPTSAAALTVREAFSPVASAVPPVPRQRSTSAVASSGDATSTCSSGDCGGGVGSPQRRRQSRDDTSSYSRGLMEPHSDYHADNSRSDLSDILEEEEEELYSDHLGEAQPRGYAVGANRSRKLETPDSDEDVLERILKLPPQVPQCKQLFSIAEMTEEEDSSQEEPLLHRSKPRPGSILPRDSEHLHYPHPPDPHIPNRDPRSLAKEPSVRQDPPQLKTKTQHRKGGHAPESDGCRHCRRGEPRPWPYPAKTLPGQQDGADCEVAGRPHDGDRRGVRHGQRRARRVRARGGGAGADELRVVGRGASGGAQQAASPQGAEGRSSGNCSGCRPCVDPALVSPRGCVDPQRITSPPLTRNKPASLPAALWNRSEPGQIPPAVAGPSRGGQAELSSRPMSSQARQHKGRQLLPPSWVWCEPPKIKGDGGVRIFVALFPYDPVTMSPNPDAAEEELPFSEGQIIKVYGEKDADGFYRGESGGRLGYVPCNMVSEIQVEDEETQQQLLQQGFLSTAASMEKIANGIFSYDLPRRPVPPPKPRRSKKGCSDGPHSAAPGAAAGKPASGARRMVAIFDYDPRESSPNTDIEAELTFSAGDIIHVFGDMDEDGFFYGELNGHRGLVPSNFLQAFPEEPPPPEPISVQPAPEPRKELQRTRQRRLSA
uniref:RIMS-binding protein 2 n=1 Tax=Poecilia formosa TaxID=48698 RepID=A0A096MB60_POEFO